jgi:hypothetical protein
MKDTYTVVNGHLELSRKGSHNDDNWWLKNYPHMKCMHDKMQNDVAFGDAHNECNQSGQVFDDFKSDSTGSLLPRLQ